MRAAQRVLSKKERQVILPFFFKSVEQGGNGNFLINVLSGPAIDRINDSCIKELTLLDTIPYPEDKPKCDKINYLPVAPVFAEAIERIYEEVSISTLFD